MNYFPFLFISCILLNQVTSDDDLEMRWKEFKKKYNKHYATKEEETKRMKIFEENTWPYENLPRFREGIKILPVNEFSDMTRDELLSPFVHIDSRFKSLPEVKGLKFYPKLNMTEIPDEFDWRENNKKEVVGVVENQGKCKADHVFAALGAVEAQYFLLNETPTLNQLSAQNIIDCSNELNNNGCQSGSPEGVFLYLYLFGINTKQHYPYEGRKGKVCKFDQSKSVATIDSLGIIDNEEDLKIAVASIGPIVVSFDGRGDEFQSYKGGIHFGRNCSSDKNDLTHYGLVVGYGGGSENGQDEYWLVKTSFGTDWGEKGYIKMARNRNNNCGIATNAMYPVLLQPENLIPL